jgi:galactokinase
MDEPMQDCALYGAREGGAGYGGAVLIFLRNNDQDASPVISNIHVRSARDHPLF